MEYSTTFYWSYVEHANPLTVFSNQLRAFGIGLVGFTILAVVDFALVRRVALPLLGLTVLSLLWVEFAGVSVFGAQRSLANGSYQPSEFAKLGLSIYAAAWLAGRRKELRTFTEGLLPYGVVIGFVIGLVLMQPDLSTAFVLSVVMLTMYFMSEASVGQILLVLGTFALLFVIMVQVNDHASERLSTFLASVADPWRTKDYHIRQLMLTLGSGGWLGHGIGASYQKFSFLPTPHTDSIVAVLVDEMGFVGLIFFLGLVGVFVWRGVSISMNSRSAFGAYLAVGITVWVAVQTSMNLLSVLALIPFTGVPVPFISYGGSSLVSLLLACGMLASISRGSVMDTATAPAEAAAEQKREPSKRRIQRNGQLTFLASHDLSRWNRRPRAAGAERPARAWSHAQEQLERLRRRFRRQVTGRAVRRRE
jgi:cell division protein FtsW